MPNAKKPKQDSEDMLPEYDFTSAVQGKYFKRFQRMRLKILIDPDVARVFPDSESVNSALRALARSKASASKARARRKAG